MGFYNFYLYTLQGFRKVEMLQVSDDRLSLFFSREKNVYPLFGEENINSVNFSEGRLMDFSTGRYCARKAFEYFGVYDIPIPVGEKREPLWPQGFVGSISHCKPMAGAVIARNDQVLSVGLDIEELGRVTADLWDYVFTENERGYLNKLDKVEQEIQATGIFCVKEAFYKFQFPLTGKFLGFQEVEVLMQESSISLEIINPVFRKTLSDLRTDFHVSTKNDVCICLVKSVK